MIEFLTSLSLLWLIGVSLLIIIAILLEKEEIGWATFLYCIGVIAWTFKNGFDGGKYITENPSTVILITLGYVLVGVLWSLIKWYFYTSKYFIDVKGVKDEFMKNHGEITKENIGALYTKLDGLGHSYFRLNSSHEKTTIFNDYLDSVVPKAKEKKALIISWISYWPISLLATLLNNPFRKFFEWIYNNISGAYDEITNNQKNNILND